MNDVNEIKLKQSADLYHISKLCFSGIELLIPQSDVLSIESVYELIEEKKHQGCVGYIQQQVELIPAYCMEAELELLDVIPENRTQCVVLRHMGKAFSIVCEEVKNIQLSDIDFESVPDCIAHPGMPLSHLAIYSESEQGQQLGLISNADLLGQYMLKHNDRVSS